MTGNSATIHTTEGRAMGMNNDPRQPESAVRPETPEREAAPARPHSPRETVKDRSDSFPAQSLDLLSIRIDPLRDDPRFPPLEARYNFPPDPRRGAPAPAPHAPAL